MAPEDAQDPIDPKALRCFWATARLGSLTRAGRELGISESAVAQRLRALETRLGAKLYEARGGRVRLTAAGERALDLTVAVLDQLATLARVVAAEEAAGTLTLAADGPVLRFLLPDVIQRFARMYPRARLRLLGRLPRDTVALVRTNEVDFGVIPERPCPGSLVFHPWRTYEAYLVTSRGHPLARRARASFEALLTDATMREHPLIVPEADDPNYQRLAAALRRRGLPYCVAIEVGTVESVKPYVARGLGIAVLPGICLTVDDRATLESVPLPRDLQGDTTYGVVVRRDKRPSELLRGLLTLMGVPADQPPLGTPRPAHGPHARGSRA
jgi:DNA-binding transcriptional LysR family regulator